MERGFLMISFADGDDTNQIPVKFNLRILQNIDI